MNLYRYIIIFLLLYKRLVNTVKGQYVTFIQGERVNILIGQNEMFSYDFMLFSIGRQIIRSYYIIFNFFK